MCWPLSLPAPKRWSPPIRPTPSLSPRDPAPLGREKKAPELHSHQPPPWLRTLNTSHYSTTPSLARPSGTPKSMPGWFPTATRPVSTGEAHMTWPLSPQATYTPTTTPPPPTLKQPLAPAQAARTKRKSARSPPANKLRVRSPLLLRRGLPPSQVPNVDSLLPASPPPLTQTLRPLQQPSPT